MSEYTVKQARQLRGYSQPEMAELMGISKNAYIMKENGDSRFYVDEAYLFADKVSIPFEKIFFLQPSSQKTEHRKEE